MKVLIIDDDQSFCKELKTDFYSFFKTIDEKLEITILSSDFHKALLYENIDIVFMDVKLESLDGIGLTKMMREKNPYAIFVIMSVVNGLVNEGLQQTLSMSLKKNNYYNDIKTLFESIKYRMMLEYKKEDCERKGRKEYVFLKDIEYIRSLGHYLFFYSDEQSYMKNGSLSRFIEENENPAFCQISRNIVINFKYTKYIKDSHVYMKNGEIFKIGRKYEKDVDKSETRFMTTMQ